MTGKEPYELIRKTQYEREVIFSVDHGMAKSIPDNIKTLALKLTNGKSFHFCTEIRGVGEEIKKLVADYYGCGETEFNEILCLDVLFNIGYIQGVRNERAKRKRNGNSAPVSCKTKRREQMWR